MDADLKPLDFDLVRHLLGRLCATPYGTDAARALEPAPDIETAQRLQRAATIARQHHESGVALEHFEWPDLRPAFRQAASQGSALSGQAFFNLQTLMTSCSRISTTIRGTPELFAADPTDLEGPEDLIQALQNAFEGAGSLRQDASLKLTGLFSQRKALRKAADQIIQRKMRTAELRSLFEPGQKTDWYQERAVIRLRQEDSAKIRGVRRDSRLGGRDVLVEPIEAVAVNNQLETLNGQIGIEQQRILRELTDQVRRRLPVLDRMVSALTWIDLAMAAGRLSAVMNAHPPQLTEDAGVILRQAYHPLLLVQFAEGTGPKPVPLSVRLDHDQPLLLVSGPNTGGKTVALKTVGLLVAMAHSGLHIPAEEDCVVGCYLKVVADIGDHQNLYHHLSTFAGHVEVLKRVLDQAGPNTLVLLDELGTGTDPEEGAALAMAVLDELVKRGVQGMINTHLSPIKEYALSHPQLQIASMRFDHEALRPTYELLIGKPGQSLGLLIAGQRGLDEEMILRAREHLACIRGTKSL